MNVPSQHNKKVWRGLISTLVLFACISAPGFAHAEQARIKPIKNITVDYTAKNKMRVQWTKRKQAKSYVVRVKKGSKVIKRVVTSKKKVVLKKKLFTHNKKYTVYVRAKKTKKRRASKWRYQRTRYYSKNVTVTPVKETARQDGASIWLYPVNEGNTDSVVLSTESGSEIKLARTSVDSIGEQQQWTTVVNASDLGETAFADHAHIYAHGYHWISVSTSSAVTSYLLKIDTDFNLVDSTQIVDNEIVETDAGTNSIATNDMFIVPEENGVAVGHFWPSVGHKVYRFKKNLDLRGTKKIGGGEYAHGNGSWMLKTDDGFALLANDSINHIQESGLTLHELNSDWEFTDSTTLINELRFHLSMVHGAYTSDGYLIIHARTNEDVYTNEELISGEDIEDDQEDGGSITRYVFTPHLVLADTKTMYSSDDGNRGRLTVLDDNTIIGTWDLTNKTYIYSADFDVE